MPAMISQTKIFIASMIGILAVTLATRHPPIPAGPAVGDATQPSSSPGSVTKP